MDKLSTKHLIFIIWGTTIVSIKTNVNVFIRDGGRDTWLAMTIASFFTLFFLIYINNTFKKNSEFNIVKVYQVALGKFLGNIFLLALIMNFILSLIESASVESSAMHTNLLIETPTWYLIIFFIIPAIYTVKKNVVTVVTVAIIGVLFAIFAGINLVIMTAKYKDYKYLLPILSNGITQGFIISTIKALGFYGSIMVLFPYFSYVNDKKRLKRDTIVGLFFVIQMHIVSISGAIAAYGPDRAITIVYPKLNQTQEINYFGFLESGEFFVMFQIIGGWFVKYILTFFAALKLLKDMHIENKYLIYPVTLIVYISSFYISNNLSMLTEYLNSYAYICLTNYIILPCIIFFIYNIRNKKNLKKPKAC